MNNGSRTSACLTPFQTIPTQPAPSHGAGTADGGRTGITGAAGQRSVGRWAEGMERATFEDIATCDAYPLPTALFERDVCGPDPGALPGFGLARPFGDAAVKIHETSA